MDKKYLFVTAWNIYWMREGMEEEPPDLIGYDKELRFYPGSNFQADWALVGYPILIEVNGKIGSKRRGGHDSWYGYHRDINKVRLAASIGYFVFSYTTHELNYENVRYGGKNKPPYSFTAIELIAPIHDCMRRIDRQRGEF
ncbi:MAG: hypothetical protein GTO60_16605 [Gammaproteobacteria bacterium]|nr:hypothetical protein [Gammaproteobacteria bacterium]